jgi:hypothetical protein
MGKVVHDPLAAPTSSIICPKQQVVPEGTFVYIIASNLSEDMEDSYSCKH